MSNDIRLEGVDVAFKGRPLFANVSLHVESGERVALMAPSGTGKTTILRLLSGVSVPDAGRVCMGDVVVSGLSIEQRAAFRATRVGQVFQDASLLPELTAVENVALLSTLTGNPRAAAQKRASELLGALGLANNLAARTWELSGGEAQRVAVARALMVDDVAFLLADEPTASLDLTSANRVVEALLDLSTERSLTMVIATHDDRIAARCDRIVDLIGVTA